MWGIISWVIADMGGRVGGRECGRDPGLGQGAKRRAGNVCASIEQRHDASG